MPSLQRIILINTHLHGVVELALNDHTNICGTNASGKTTLQRLVPVFYGEFPSRVVPSTRDSFERWYLPTEQSFIIYEYQRMDGELCQAVLASAGDGKGVNYRFLGKGFELDDYTKSQQDERRTFLSMAELGREFKRAGHAHTRLLNTREYRGIIQHDRALLATGSNRSELRSFASQFSLCDSEHTLRHIEKLARAVHSKEGKMETIKSMIAAILEEDGVNTPSSRLNPQRVEAWIKENQLIQGFVAIRPEFDKLTQQYQELLSCELRLAALREGFKADEPLQWQQLEQSKQVIEQTGFTLKQLEEQWKRQRDELNQQLSAANGDVSRIEDELDAIEVQYQKFLDTDVEQAKADLEQLENWRDDLDNLLARHRLLTEKHQDVETAYLERCQKIKDQRDHALELLRTQQDELHDRREQQRAAQNEQLTHLEQDFNQRRQQGLDTFRDNEYQLKLDEQRLQQQVANTGYNDDERQQLAIFEERINNADDLVEQCVIQVEQLQHREKQLKSQRDDADGALRRANKRVDERQNEAEAIRQLLYPGQHTLLEFLRRERSGWEQTLGKVIHPELLQRADLNPTLNENDQDALFGLRLDLSILSTPDYAESEQALHQRFKLAEEAVQEASAQQQQAEKQLIDASAALDELQRQLTIARTEHKNARDDQRRIKDEKRTTLDKLNDAVQQRKREAQKQCSDAAAQLKQLLHERDQWLADLKEQHGEAKIEKTAYWQEVLGALDEQLQQLRDNQRERRSKAEQELQQCQRWYQSELQSRGIDEHEIITLKQQIGELETRITRTGERRSDVLRYDDWYQHSWLQRKPKLQQELGENRAEASELTQQLKAANQQYKQQRDQLEQDRQQAQQRQGEAEQALNKLKALMRKLSELKLPEQHQPGTGELSERLRQGEDYLLNREQLLVAIKGYIERFDNVIASQSGSGLAETWERAREECTLVGDNGNRQLDYRKLVPHLEQLLNVMVPQSITALREQGKIFGVDLNSYYDVLADIDRRIASQSARITREVSEELFLDGVSDSAVRIRSRISELEFWPELQTFIKEFRAWKTEGFSGLPSEQYTSAMRRALDVIGRSALTSGVTGLLEIELRLREGNSDLVIRTDRQLNESSSHGMAYLILCKFLLAFTRLLRGEAPVTIHWPIDELGTLHHNNVKKIFDACSNNNIRILGAFPNPDSEVLTLFSNRYIVNKQTRQLQVVKPKVDVIAEKLKQRQQEAV